MKVKVKVNVIPISEVVEVLTPEEKEEFTLFMDVLVCPENNPGCACMKDHLVEMISQLVYFPSIGIPEKECAKTFRLCFKLAYRIFNRLMEEDDYDNITTVHNGDYVNNRN